MTVRVLALVEGATEERFVKEAVAAILEILSFDKDKGWDVVR